MRRKAAPKVTILEDEEAEEKERKEEVASERKEQAPQNRRSVAAVKKADRTLRNSGYLKKGKIDMHIPCADADTAEGRTRLERDALFETMRVVSFLRRIEGLENLTVDTIAHETGVRETKRIVGRHIITAEEYINGVSYPDSVCYAFYPIDLHVERGIRQRFHEENTVARIPYRALIPKSSRRVLCTGRCISSDTYANSAVRVEAVCMATGQAAGAAASVMLAENADAPDVSYGSLCAALRSLGAIVPV